MTIPALFREIDRRLGRGWGYAAGIRVHLANVWCTVRA